LDTAAEAAADLLRDHKRHDTAAGNPVHFVTHGTGALVLRRAFQLVDWEGQASRVVMLGPPNRGAGSARRAGRAAVWRWCLGHGVLGELASLSPRHFLECGDPPRSSSVLVVAGVSSGPVPWIPGLPWVPRGLGPHDGAVTVRETALRTPYSLLRVRASHPLLPLHDAAIDATVAFLAARTPSSGLRLAEQAARASLRWRRRPLLPMRAAGSDGAAPRAPAGQRGR